MSGKKRVVFLTKEPLTGARVEALRALSGIPSICVVGVFIEDVMHLPFRLFFLRTVERIRKGHIYLPEFLANCIVKVFAGKGNAGTLFEQEDRKFPVYKVKNIEAEESLEKIRSLKPDLGIIFGHRMLRRDVIDIPRDGMINVHYGLLPRYAGNDYSTFWALAEGEKEVGLTIHKVDEKPDHGPILLIEKIPVDGRKRGVLENEIARMAPVALKKAVQGICDGSLNYYQPAAGVWKYWKPPGFFERIKYKRCL